MVQYVRIALPVILAAILLWLIPDVSWRIVVAIAMFSAIFLGIMSRIASALDRIAYSEKPPMTPKTPAIMRSPLTGKWYVVTRFTDGSAAVKRDVTEQIEAIIAEVMDDVECWNELLKLAGVQSVTFHSIPEAAEWVSQHFPSGDDPSATEFERWLDALDKPTEQTDNPDK